MAFKKTQLQDLIERTLKEINLYSPAAVNLLLGTAAQESLFGTYLRQLGFNVGKGAQGCFQMERPTFDDLKRRYGDKFPVIKSFTFEQLEWDLKAQIIMARIKYYSCPGPIPEDLNGQAKYYKQYYNSPLGAATVEDYLKNYDKYVTHG